MAWQLHGSLTLHVPLYSKKHACGIDLVRPMIIWTGPNFQIKTNGPDQSLPICMEDMSKALQKPAHTQKLKVFRGLRPDKLSNKSQGRHSPDPISLNIYV